MKNKSWSLKQFLALGIEALLAYFILFTKWVRIDLIYSDYSTSLLKIATAMSRLSKYVDYLEIDSGPLIAIALLVYILLVVCAFSFWNTTSSIFNAHTTNNGIEKTAFKISILLVVVILVFLFIVNLVVDSRTDGYIYSLFSMKPKAYLPTLALGIAGCLVCDKLPDTPVFSAKSDASNPLKDTLHKAASFIAENAAAVAQDAATATEKAAAPSEKTATPAEASASPDAPTLLCPSCGSPAKSADAQFCAFCGAKLLREFHCPNCGKKLEPDMKFCPYCAAKVGGSTYHEGGEGK